MLAVSRAFLVPRATGTHARLSGAHPSPLPPGLLTCSAVCPLPATPRPAHFDVLVVAAFPPGPASCCVHAYLCQLRATALRVAHPASPSEESNASMQPEQLALAPRHLLLQDIVSNFQGRQALLTMKLAALDVQRAVGVWITDISVLQRRLGLWKTCCVLSR